MTRDGFLAAIETASRRAVNEYVSGNEYRSSGTPKSVESWRVLLYKQGRLSGEETVQCSSNAKWGALLISMEMNEKFRANFMTL